MVVQGLRFILLLHAQLSVEMGSCRGRLRWGLVHEALRPDDVKSCGWRLRPTNLSCALDRGLQPFWLVNFQCARQQANQPANNMIEDHRELQKLCLFKQPFTRTLLGYLPASPRYSSGLLFDLDRLSPRPPPAKSCEQTPRITNLPLHPFALTREFSNSK